MKRQIIGVSIFLAIAVIGIGIYYFGDNQKINNGNNTTGQSNSQTKETSGNDLPQVKKLNCEYIIDDKEKENCQAGVTNLLNSENSSPCENLTTAADKNACLHSYIIKQAAQSGDLAKCQEASSAALIADCTSQASFSLAIQKKDKKYCGNIVDKTGQENCLKTLVNLGVK